MKDHFFIHISDGQIINKSVIRKAFAGLKNGRHQVTIESKNNRSIQQNRYYHGVVVPIVKDGLRDAGFGEVKSSADAHEILKYLFLKKRIVNEETGEVIELLGTTTILTTIEFNEFVDEIIRWASEYLGIQIPLPNEQMEFFTSKPYHQ